jgi:serine/threonine protein kinase
MEGIVHTRLIGSAKANSASSSLLEETIVVQENEPGRNHASPGAPPALPDNERTITRFTDNTLPIGTHIREFKITDVIATGGFGIVYLAQDLSLGRYVALKEYMPTSLAERVQGTTVAVKSAHFAETFEAGLRSFVNEARLLAQFDHRALVKVYRFWEENGTAYMIMPFLEGLTLQKALAEMTGPPDEFWLKGMLAEVLDALEVIHREHCFHRDISPDNILILKNGQPLLLDFGAARRIIGDRNQALTVILKPSYAPPEQYSETPDARQGAWTDIYALGAVLYCAITGKPPTPSISRVMNDTLLPLTQTAAGRYSAGFLGAIDSALALRPEKRPQSVAQWRQALFAENEAASTIARIPPSLEKKASPWPRLASLVLLIAGIGAGAYVALLPPAPVEMAAVSLGAPQTPSLEKTQAAPTSAEHPTTREFDPIQALDQVFEQRDRNHPVTVAIDQSTVKIGRDKLRFRVTSPQAGYLYVLMVGTDRGHFNLLFPNAIDKNNKVGSGKELALPRAGWSMTAGGPAGTNHFVAIVSENPRDFSAAGLVSVDPFGEFSLEIAAKISANTSGPSPFAGRPDCPPPNSCSAAYGAATFSIQEID